MRSQSGEAHSSFIHEAVQWGNVFGWPYGEFPVPRFHQSFELQVPSRKVQYETAVNQTKVSLPVIPCIPHRSKKDIVNRKLLSIFIVQGFYYQLVKVIREIDTETHHVSHFLPSLLCIHLRVRLQRDPASATTIICPADH